MFFISFCTLGSETQSTTAHKKETTIADYGRVLVAGL